MVLTQVVVVVSLSDVSGVQLGSQRVDVKEWVFSVVNLSCWHPVQALESLVSDSRQVHVCSLVLYFDSLELCIVEIVCVIHVLDLSGVNLILKLSEILFAVLHVMLGCVFLFCGQLISFMEISIDCLGSSLGETLPKQILAANLGHIACVAWDVLGLKSISWSSNPCVPLPGLVGELDCFAKLG